MSLLDEYMTESKGNVIDKVLGKDVERVIKSNNQFKMTHTDDNISDKPNKRLATDNKIKDNLQLNSKIRQITGITNKDKINSIKQSLIDRHNGEIFDEYRPDDKKNIQIVKRSLGLGGNIKLTTNESTNAKLNIYDSYEIGLLTESEKNELLSFFESDYSENFMPTSDFIKVIGESKTAIKILKKYSDDICKSKEFKNIIKYVIDNKIETKRTVKEDLKIQVEKKILSRDKYMIRVYNNLSDKVLFNNDTGIKISDIFHNTYKEIKKDQRLKSLNHLHSIIEGDDYYGWEVVFNI